MYIVGEDMINEEKGKNSKKWLVIGLIILLLVVGLGVFIGTKYFKNDLNNAQEVEHKDKKANVLKNELILEIGSELPNVSEYYDNYQGNENEEIKYYLNDVEVSLDELVNKAGILNQLKEINEYKVVINGADETKLKVVDTTKPEVKLQELTIAEGDTYDIKSFVLEYKDNSNSDEYVITYKNSENGSLNKEGTYDIELTICDQYENCVDAATKLIISKTGSSNNSNSNSNSNSTTNKGTTGNNSSTTTKPSTGNSSTSNSGSSNNSKPSGSTSNSGSSSNSSSNNSTNTPKTYVKDVTEKVITKKETKYGTTINHYSMVTYKLYSDGSKEEKSRTAEKVEINYKTFNGKVADMKKEATNLYNGLSSSRTTILNETNKYRQEKNIPNLTLDKDLSMIATIKAIEMAYSNIFDHRRPGNKQWYTLHTEYGYKNYKTIAENIAYNSSTDLAACKAWRESSGHYANMINSSMTKIGIGKYTFNGRTYYVQEFAG